MPLLGTLMGFSLLFGSATFTKVNVVASTTAVASAQPSYTVTVTAYNAVVGQTDDNPLETASGAYSNPEIVAARSQDLRDKMPFGTIVELDGSGIRPGDSCGFGVVAPRIGYRVIADTMHARYTDRIDVLFDTDGMYKTSDRGMVNAAHILGICKGVTVRVVGHVDINHLPKTQSELAKLVENPSVTLAAK